MRIAQVCPRYYPQIGGVETHVREISERLAKKGFDVHVLTTDPEGALPKEETINNVTVVRFRSWAPQEAYYSSFELKKYLSTNRNYEIVHAHNYHAFPALYAAQTKKANRLIFTPRFHGSGHTLLRSLLLIPYRFLGRSIFEKADRVICLTPYERTHILSQFRINENKLTILPNGVTKAEFTFTKNETGTLRRILTVSRLERYKGIQHIVQALSKMSADVSLDIVGKGPYEEQLVRIIHKLGVHDRVSLRSDLTREELLRLYAGADVFVMLSKHEAFGNVIAEALASGTRCVLANVPELLHWIDNKNCFGIDYPIEVNRLVNLIAEVAGKRTHGVRIDDWDDVVLKLQDIYINN